MRRIHISIAAVVSFLFALQAGDVAMARSFAIKCDGSYQLVKGHGPIATPYCQDDNLANVARSYGMRFSTAEIHNTPEIKHQVCAAIGHDNRVYTACDGFRLDGESGRFGD